MVIFSSGMPDLDEEEVFSTYEALKVKHAEGEDNYGEIFYLFQFIKNMELK